MMQNFHRKTEKKSFVENLWPRCGGGSIIAEHGRAHLKCKKKPFQLTQVWVLTWSSLVESEEQPDRPSSQKNFNVAIHVQQYFFIFGPGG